MSCLVIAYFSKFYYVSEEWGYVFWSRSRVTLVECCEKVKVTKSVQKVYLQLTKVFKSLYTFDVSHSHLFYC